MTVYRFIFGKVQAPRVKVGLLGICEAKSRYRFESEKLVICHEAHALVFRFTRQ
jgi:hypothetical protein